MKARDQERVRLLGVRHHGPGSAVLVRRALEQLNPECVLIEGPPEGNALLEYVADPELKPPVAMLMHAVEEAGLATFVPFAEFSPEWQAIGWALERGRPVRFIDWPAAVSLADRKEEEEAEGVYAVDLLAEAAGYSDGESFWNAMVEQQGQGGQDALAVFAALEKAMTEARAAETGMSEAALERYEKREAFMRIGIRAALKEFAGAVAVVTGAWHVAGLRRATTNAEDRALVKDLPKVKVEATWVPWTDSRLSAMSGYGAGVISPGWYRHLWSFYRENEARSVTDGTAAWQAQTAVLLRQAGFGASTAVTIEATRLALGLAAMRGLVMPGIDEMRDASLAVMCHGNPVPLAMVEQRLYVGERVGEIGTRVPQNPLARDLALWQRKTRLKPQDIDQELKLDLRSEAGLERSTLLHRLQLIGVGWGSLVDAQSGRGTFREVWQLRWQPEYSVALAEALVHGVTIEQAAGNASVARARASQLVGEVAGLIQQALVADLNEAALVCVDRMQELAVHSADLDDLMAAVPPLVKVLRYGSARVLPEEGLWRLVSSVSVEVLAGLRFASRGLDEEAARLRMSRMEVFDEALALLGDEGLRGAWWREMELLVGDETMTPAIAGLALRRLNENQVWAEERVNVEFSRRMSGREPKAAGAFLEGFLRGGAELLLQDEVVLGLMDEWLCGLEEEDFVASLPLLRRSLGGFDAVTRRRLLERLQRGRVEAREVVMETEGSGAFEQALPLLRRILGVGGEA